MRSIRTLMQELTIEEFKAIENRAKKALLFNLLSEAGYVTAKMQKVTYTNVELKERLITAIRNDKIEIQSLKTKLVQADKKYKENLDNLFEALRKLKGNVV